MFKVCSEKTAMLIFHEGPQEELCKYIPKRRYVEVKDTIVNTVSGIRTLMMKILNTKSVV